MSETNVETPDFGELDGQKVKRLLVRLSGGGAFSRLPHPGERVVLVVEGEVLDKTSFTDDGGSLARTHQIKVTRVGEPTEQLADEAEGFLRFVASLEETEPELPFDKEPEGEEPPPSE